MGRVHRWDVVYGVYTFDFLVLHLRVLAELELPDRAADAPIDSAGLCSVGRGRARHPGRVQAPCKVLL
jgi:hypothetical protein